MAQQQRPASTVDADPGSSPPRTPFWVWIVRLLLAGLLAPLAAGVVLVTYRDAAATHFPAKAVTGALLRAGEAPLVHPSASCVQALAGNPNFGTFFPDTLLFAVLPLAHAFALHFALAFALAFFGARCWARSSGASKSAAEAAGAAFACSGVFLSAWTFYNAGMALAVAPWVMAGATKLFGRSGAGEIAALARSTAEVACWFALEILAGEPVIALLTLVLLAARAAAGVAFAGGGDARRSASRAAAAVLGALLLSALLAAPQLLLTRQLLEGSSRNLAPFSFRAATTTSVDAARWLEQATPLPFGRPDLRGTGGFAGHQRFDGNAPYLWSLHLGWLSVLMLVLFGRPRAVNERLAWLAFAAAAILATGRGLPGASLLYPLLSLGGRIRYPVKWWYVAALALAPLVARSVSRWEAGDRPSRPRLIGASLLVAGGVAATLLVLTPAEVWRWVGPASPLLWAAAVVACAATDPWRSVGLAAALLFAGGLLWACWRGRRWPAGLLAAAMALTLLAPHAPLFFAVLDRPPPSPPAVTEGRVFERVSVDIHPLPEHWVADAEPTPSYMRRAPLELWAVAGAVGGVRYAFNPSGDGSETYFDRIAREALNAASWEQRVVDLRLAGVSRVVTDETPPAMFRELGRLPPDGRVGLFALEGASPSVRLATRVHRAPHINAVFDIHRSTSFDPATDVVLPGDAFGISGAPTPARVHATVETPDRLAVRTECPAPGVLVWSRSFHPAWRALVDGAAAHTVVAEGHLLGILIPAGNHDVSVVWSRRPLVAGGVLAFLGLAAVCALRRCGRARASQPRPERPTQPGQ